jgi:hypothetical protein
VWENIGSVDWRSNLGLKIGSQANLFKFLLDEKEAIRVKGSKTQCVQQNPPNGRILLTSENCNTFKKKLERLFEEEISFHVLHSHRLTHLIQSALDECKRAKIKKSKTNFFPVNAWFDEECKKARRRWKESDKDNIKLKAYQEIVRKKKGDFMVSRREELIFLGKNNPKLF